MAILLVLSACSVAKRSPPAPDLNVTDRLAAADALVRAGCLDCLVAAFDGYSRLKAVPSVADAATAGAARTAILISTRERELGIEDSGYLPRARELSASREPLRAVLDPLLEIADAWTTRGVRGGPPSADDAVLERTELAFKNRDRWLERLRADVDRDPVTADLWLGLNCALQTPTRDAVDSWMAQLSRWQDVPLLTMKRATCGAVEGAILEELLRADDRFLELHYYLGNAAMLAGRLNSATAHLEAAYSWRPRWPNVTTQLANIALGVEDFERALEYYGRTLAIVPTSPDALLGKTRALSYVARHADAVAAADELLALGHWYIGDARYWRAFNEMHLGQNETAWEDVEAAGRLLMNAEVPKLAGMIAYRLQHVDVAQQKFEQSRERNPRDCETAFYLGVVLAERSVWSRAADVLMETAGCLDAAERDLEAQIEQIRHSDEPPERQQRRIARREQQIASARRMRVTSWFNIAVASYNLSRKDDARQYAEKVADDDQFGERARELLGRLK
jgi:tetratricopeptide (TPR) repeat protein